jgi:hypothetical protein
MAGSIVTTAISGKSRGIVKFNCVITTHTDGTTPEVVIGSAFGRIVAIGYDADNMDAGAVITLKDKDSGAALVTLTSAGTADRLFRPTANVTANTGVAVTPATTAVDVNRDIFVAGKLSLVVSAGGTSMGGKLQVVIQEGV